MIFMKKWPTTFSTILKLVQQILEGVLQLAARLGVFGKEDCLEIEEEEKSANGQVENGDAPGTRRWKSQAQVNIFSFCKAVLYRTHKCFNSFLHFILL